MGRLDAMIRQQSLHWPPNILLMCWDGQQDFLQKHVHYCGLNFPVNALGCISSLSTNSAIFDRLTITAVDLDASIYHV